MCLKKYILSKQHRLPCFLALFFMIFLTISNGNEAANALSSSDSLVKRFDTPPAAARPWVRWWWLDRQSEESITRDLEALKAKGIGGMILYACDGSILPEDIFGPLKMYRMPEWVERVNHAGVKKQSIN